MIRLRKLLTRSSKVTHLQLPHSCKLPFWGTWRISLLIHSLGTFSSFHIWWIWVFGWSGLSLISTFLQLSDLLQGLSSFWAPSMQLFLLVLRVSRQKYLASFSVLCSCSSWGGDSEISLFSTFLKCSFHLANLPSLLFNWSPSLLFTAAFCLFPFPVNCFRIFLFLSCIQLLSVFFRLSSLPTSSFPLLHFFDCFIFLYIGFHLSCIDYQILCNLFMISFLPSFSIHLSSLIQGLLFSFM